MFKTKYFVEEWLLRYNHNPESTSNGYFVHVSTYIKYTYETFLMSILNAHLIIIVEYEIYLSLFELQLLTVYLFLLKAMNVKINK